MREARLRVRVTPRSGRTEVGAWDGQTLGVRVAAPPVEGAANEALRDLLAGLFGCARSRVTIERGHGARVKQVRVLGLTEAALRDALGGVVSSTPRR